MATTKPETNDTIGQIAAAVEKIEDAVVETKGVVAAGKDMVAAGTSSATADTFQARILEIRQQVDAVKWAASDALELLTKIIDELAERDGDKR